MRAIATHDEKRQALEFLEELQARLGACLPSARTLDDKLREINARAKGIYEERHLKGPESAFLNAFVVPKLFTDIMSLGGLTELEARTALLVEDHPCMTSICCGAVARTVKHPFTKELGRGAGDIYRRWAQQNAGSPLAESCPDFALRNPFRHKIVFEGKYFRSGSLDRAEKELATNIYQAFFYRGLPAVPETKRGRAAWDYDYSCLLAFDASRNGTLKQAWKALPKPIRKGFWDGANVFVMILGGDG